MDLPLTHIEQCRILKDRPLARMARDKQTSPRFRFVPLLFSVCASFLTNQEPEIQFPGG